MGSLTTASGDFSTAMGLLTISSGQYSTAMGSYTTAPSANETVIGRWNTDYAGSPHTWYSGQRLFVIGNGTSDQLRSNAMTVLKNGRVGLQTITSPDFALELPNSTEDGTGKGRANAWTTYSDSRVKSAQAEISYGLEEIMLLNPVKYYQHNSTFEKGELVISNEGANDIGFIAQDLYRIIPEIVNIPEDENTSLWGMNYEKLTPVLVKAIQEQQSEIDALKKIVQQQQAQISVLLQLAETAVSEK
jgi:hypothetical protein